MARQLEIPGLTPPPDHVAALERHRRRAGWVRATCLCGWCGPWRDGLEAEAWDDAAAHERRPAA